MNGQVQLVYRMLLRIVLWLPVFFLLWYYLVPVISGPLVWFSFQVLDFLFPQIIDRIHATESGLYILTSLTEGPAAEHQLAVETRPMRYLYGIPLLLALVAATPGDERISTGLLGAMLIFPFAVWGVVFDVLKSLSFGLSEHFLPVAGLSGLHLEFVVLGYQLGTLIFPPVAPLILWAALDQQFFRQMCGFPESVEHSDAPAGSAKSPHGGAPGE